MVKKLGLLLTIAALSIASAMHCSDKAMEIKARKIHILQEMQKIAHEVMMTGMTKLHGSKHMKSKLGKTYKPLAAQVIKTVNNIVTSKEYNDSLTEITDYQFKQIVNNGIYFDDISISRTKETIFGIYSPRIGDPEVIFINSLNFKINDELTKAFPSLDQDTEQLFNLFYTTTSNDRHCNLLIEKLTEEVEKLEQKLQEFEASNAPIST